MRIRRKRRRADGARAVTIRMTGLLAVGAWTVYAFIRTATSFNYLDEAWLVHVAVGLGGLFLFIPPAVYRRELGDGKWRGVVQFAGAIVAALLLFLAFGKLLALGGILESFKRLYPSLAAVLVGGATLFTAGRLSDSRRGFWVYVLAVTILVRVPWLALGLAPEGLAEEEHRTAFRAVEILNSIDRGGFRAGLHYPNIHMLLALAFSAFGIEERALRYLGLFLSILTNLFMAGTLRQLFSGRTSVILFGLFATSFSMTSASFLIQDAYTSAPLLLCALLFFLTRLFQRMNILDAILLGIVTGLVFMEYAAAKPGAFVALAFMGAPFLRPFFGPKEKRKRHPGPVLPALVFFLAFLLVATPAIVEITGDGRGFFDGRKQSMIGAAAARTFRKNLPNLSAGLETQFFRFFSPTKLIWADSLGSLRSPLLDPLTGLLGLAALLFPLFVLVRDRAVPSPRALLWSGWILLSYLYCAYWNGISHTLVRFVALVPVLFLLMGDLLGRVERSFRGRWVVPALCGLFALGTAVNAGETLGHLSSMHYRYYFRSKVGGLCGEMNRRPPDTRYLLLADWMGGIYLGDTPLDEFVKRTATAGVNHWESWACRHDYHVRYVRYPAKKADLPREIASEEKPQVILLATRFRKDAELFEDPESVRSSRLDELQREAAPWIRPETCRALSGGAWYGFRVCEAAP